MKINGFLEMLVITWDTEKRHDTNIILKRIRCEKFISHIYELYFPAEIRCLGKRQYKLKTKL